jgi:hypothetical protein
MYLRDAEYAASRLRSRVDGAGSPVAAVGAWIDEIFGFRRSRARSARVEALRTVHGAGAEGADEVAARARALLCEPLVDAISAGVAEGDFCADIDAARAADHIAVLVLDAAGVTSPDAPRRERQESTTVFCLRALGTSAADLHGIVP